MDAAAEPAGVRRRTGARPFWAAVAVSAAFLAIFTLWINLDVGGERASHVFDDIATTLVPTAAAVLCFLAGARATGASRRAWRLIGAATSSWALGELAWAVYELGFGREVPFPSVADIGYLAFIPLIIAGLLVIPSAPARVAGRVRTVIDALVIAGSLLFVSWGLVLGPLYSDASEPLLAKAIGLAYPIGDMAIVVVGLMLIMRAQHGSRSPLFLLTFGVTTLAVADSVFSYLTLSGAYTTGDNLDTLWVAAFLLVGLAAVRRMTADGARAPEEKRPSVARALVPYAPTIPALVLAVWRGAGDRPLGHVLVFDGICLLTLLFARQFLTLTENIKLNHNLEATVRERTRDLRASERASRAVLDTANDAFVSLDADARIVDWNPMAEAMFGWAQAEALGRTPQETMAPDLPELNVPRAAQRLGLALVSSGNGRRFEATARHRNGRTFPVEITAWASEAFDGIRLNVFVRDVSEQKELEAQLKHQALHDALTGLPNRVLFEDRIVQAIARFGRGGHELALMFLDLDDFKAVNESLGHPAGDRVLTEVGERLRGALRPADTVARFAGDQFAILIEEAHEDDLRSTATRLTQTLEAPMIVEDREISVRCTIGIVQAAERQSARELMRNADAALHEAKVTAKGSFRFYEPTMHARVVDRFDLEADLRRAIERDQIEVAYQPIVDLATGRLAGVEALARWRHPTRGNVPPAEFVPVAEATGLVVPLGRSVLEQACREASSWRKRFPLLPIRLSVNLSVGQIAGQDVATTVRSILARTGLPPDALVLEITESVFLQDGEHLVAALESLHLVGAKIAIDDFGTGYSSFGYLRRLPVDLLKIDKSFVDGIPERDGDAGIVRGIVRIAETLGLDVTAEGIERPEQATALAELGCRYGQGFVFARALPAARIADLIEGGTPLYAFRQPSLHAARVPGVA